MKKQLDFIRETRRLEKQSAEIEKGFLIFVSDKLRQTDALTTAEKYTLLTAFVEEFTTGGGVVSHSIFEMSGADKTASKLADIMHSYDLEYGLEEKREAIAAALQKNDNEWAEWDKANSPVSPLLPNR